MQIRGNETYKGNFGRGKFYKELSVDVVLK